MSGPEPAPPDAPDDVIGDEAQTARAGPLAHLVAGLFPVALGLICLAYSVTLSLGTPANAGPGLWPAVASVVLVGAGLWSLLFERGVRDTERFNRGALGIAAGIVSLVFFVLLVGRVGFEIPTVLLLAFWLKLLGRESWRVTAAVSVLTTAALYVIFVVLLSAPLPRLTF